MQNIGLVLEYNGERFAGWQTQPEERSIESELLAALRTVLREDVRAVYGSGRTDSGVHAKAQVCNFKTDCAIDLDTLAYSISSILKEDVAVRGVFVAPPNFHSRKSAIAKRYCYRILTRKVPPVLDFGKVAHVAAELDLDAMRKVLDGFVGQHDFSSFRAAGCGSPSPVKTIYGASISEVGEILEIRFLGAGFMKQMVRILVGTLLEVGKGRERRSAADLLCLLDRTQVGPTAPARGLFLEQVYYPVETVMSLRGDGKRLLGSVEVEELEHRGSELVKH